MHRLMAPSTILEHELAELRLLVERQTGILLDCPNSALAAHLADYIEAQDLGTSATLLERLRSAEQDPASLPALLDGLISTNTGFFRHPGALNALARQVVPQLCARKSVDGPSPLRIWSAGCSTGEEAYSIAMAVCDALSQNAASSGNTGNGASNANPNGNGKSAARTGGIVDSTLTAPGSGNLSAALAIHIVGSDLLPHNIEAADRGVYRQSALDGLPPATIRNYFSKISSPASLPNLDEQVDGQDRDEEATVEGMNGSSGSSRNSQQSRAVAAHLLVK